LQIAALVSDLSDLASSEISQEFQSFGVDLVNFNIESINIPDDEMKKIQEVFAKAMEARELSKVDVGGAFAQIKTFEVLNNAASKIIGWPCFPVVVAALEECYFVVKLEGVFATWAFLSGAVLIFELILI
jgi:hypothetical protein